MEKATKLHYPAADNLRFSINTAAQYCNVVLEAPGLERFDLEQVRKLIIEHVRIALVTSELNGSYCLQDNKFLFTISGGVLCTVKRLKPSRRSYDKRQTT